MGKIYSLLLRPIRTFNIENNAQRIISKDKPVRAPLYSSVEQQKKLVDKCMLFLNVFTSIFNFNFLFFK